MHILHLYNTLSQKKEQFIPLRADCVRLYVCGPTVYDDAHIGNARPVVVFDILFRLLRHIYGGESVVYVRNITDLDDKINARALKNYPDLPIQEAIGCLTAETTLKFQNDVADLGCLPPTAEPRATAYIDKMRTIIEQLLTQGYAYIAQDHVLFSVAAMNEKALIPYGRLSKRDFDEMLPGARIEVADYKKDEMDFVLWKPSQAHEPAWDSPAGIKQKGRPGWHIECSAMSLAQLLEPFGGGLACEDPLKNRFDIHGGGLDLIFPHHENEIAQTCCALNNTAMANVWLHNGFVQVEGHKMSKSLGNFVTIAEILAQDLPQFLPQLAHKDRRIWAGLSARFSLLQTHYHEPLNWTQRRLEESAQELYRWYKLLRAENIDVEQKDEEAISMVITILADNLNLPQMITQMRLWYKENKVVALLSAMRFLGLLFPDFVQKPQHPLFVKPMLMTLKEIENKIAQRTQFLRDKKWDEADKIRDELLKKEIVLQDVKDAQTGQRKTKWYQKDQ